MRERQGSGTTCKIITRRSVGVVWGLGYRIVLMATCLGNGHGMKHNKGESGG